EQFAPPCGRRRGPLARPLRLFHGVTACQSPPRLPAHVYDPRPSERGVRQTPNLRAQSTTRSSPRFENLKQKAEANRIPYSLAPELQFHQNVAIGRRSVPVPFA